MLSDEQRKVVQGMIASLARASVYAEASHDMEREATCDRQRASLKAAIADSDALAVERQKVRWLGLVCEATSLHGRRALEKTSNGWMVHRQGMDPLKGPEIFCEWSGSIADGYSHVDALEAAMEGGRG